MTGFEVLKMIIDVVEILAFLFVGWGLTAGALKKMNKNKDGD